MPGLETFPPLSKTGVYTTKSYKEVIYEVVSVIKPITSGHTKVTSQEANNLSPSFKEITQKNP